jgi:DNA recombination protein RmuC
MVPEPLAYVVVALAIANLLLVGWVVSAVKSQHGATSRLDLSFGGRLDGLDRHNEVLNRTITVLGQDLRKEISNGAQQGLSAAFDKVQQATNTQADQLGKLAETVRAGFDRFAERLRDEQEQLRARVDSKLEEIRTGNEAKLDQMRLAVDEQLQTALQKRLDESFQRVTEQFSQVQQAIGQVQGVAGQIGDLKRLFSNVKSRGGWGEAHLQALLDDVLPVGAYEEHFRIGEGAGAVVEFALRMPGKGATADVWLAIDAKFPTADYDRLMLANETGDVGDEAAARKALERRIREEAKRISEKYICPPYTVEYAIMYLPTEGLFAETYRTPGLIETLYRQHHVMVMGPALLPALLHYIRVGHLTFALERNAAVIGEILSAVKAEWGNFGKSLEVLARRAETLTNGIKETQKSARAVGRTLETVDAIDAARAKEMLGLSDAAALIQADLEDECTGTQSADEAFRDDLDAQAIAAQ